MGDKLRNVSGGQPSARCYSLAHHHVWLLLISGRPIRIGSIVDSRRTIEFLKSLDANEPRKRPSGVGQKTVNKATERGFIVSSISGPKARFPDLHRVTLVGVEALDQFLTVTPEPPKQRGRKPKANRSAKGM